LVRKGYKEQLAPLARKVSKEQLAQLVRKEREANKVYLELQVLQAYLVRQVFLEQVDQMVHKVLLVRQVQLDQRGRRELQEVRK
jgi:hypothetical protein